MSGECFRRRRKPLGATCQPIQNTVIINYTEHITSAYKRNRKPPDPGSQSLHNKLKRREGSGSTGGFFD